MTGQEHSPVVAAVQEAVTVPGERYLKLRRRVLRRGKAAVPAFGRLARSRHPGVRLAARAWRGWVMYGELFARVMASFDLEEETAPLKVRPHPPSAALLGGNLVRRTGPEIIPLLGEILWKTGADWKEWRREACLVALEGFDSAASGRTALDVYLATEDRTLRLEMLDLLRSLASDALVRRLRAIRGALVDPDRIQEVDRLVKAIEADVLELRVRRKKRPSKA